MWFAQLAIVAVAAIGMFLAVLLLVLGLSRRRDRRVSGRWLRARRRHDRPDPLGPLPQASASADRGPETARAGSFGYGPLSLWGEVPDDPRGW